MLDNGKKKWPDTNEFERKIKQMPSVIELTTGRVPESGKQRC